MHQVSIRKIILNDYAAFLLTVGGPVMLALSVFAAVFGFIPRIRRRGGRVIDPELAIVFCVVAVILTAVLLCLLSRRIGRIKAILLSGPRAKARVLEIGFLKDRGRIEFEYAHQGRQHRTGSAIMKNKRTTAIHSGDEIEVALDPGDASRAFVVELYRA